MTLKQHLLHGKYVWIPLVGFLTVLIKKIWYFAQCILQNEAKNQLCLFHIAISWSYLLKTNFKIPYFVLMKVFLVSLTNYYIILNFLLHTLTVFTFATVRKCQHPGARTGPAPKLCI
jgi:hypothetical protein